MKKLSILILLLVTISCIHAQKADTTGIPKYRLLNQDSVFVTNAKLKKAKPVMIIYFSPDCSHCQRLTYEMKEEFTKEAKGKLKTLSGTQIIMATWTQYKAIQVFYHDFDLVKYPNITVGTEGDTMTLLHYYKVTSTPYIAIYSKSGQLVKFFDKPAKIEDILKELKKA
jgi:thioredoxin-related protein